MKQNLVLLFIISPVLLFAKNVGIGNSNPQYPWTEATILIQRGH